ncbi:hypothetical protein ABPG74_001525 [Tetrahymena malaccensis]
MIQFRQDTFQQNFFYKLKQSITQRFQLIFHRIEQKNTIIREKIHSSLTQKLQESASNNNQIKKMKNLIEKQESKIIRFATNKSFNYAYRDVLQDKFHKSVEQDGFQQTAAYNMASGGISGIFSYMITYPIKKMIDFSKQIQINPVCQDESKEQRLQNQIDEFQRKKMFNMTFFFYSGLYFGFYDTLQQVYPVQEKRDFRLRGWEALLLAKIISYPGEFIAKKIKAYKDQESKVNSHSENLRQLVEREGSRVACRNPVSFMTRSLTNFAAISGYDYLLFGVKEQNPYIGSY